jgi:hypothetical protein
LRGGTFGGTLFMDGGYFPAEAGWH